MSNYYGSNNMNYDRQQAREMISAIQYQDTSEVAKRIQAIEAEKAARKAAKKARKESLIDDSASVSSFGSTVGLLKARFSRKHRSSKQDEDKKKVRSQLETSRIMRSQVKLSV
jgi:hypothetical protein